MLVVGTILGSCDAMALESQQQDPNPRGVATKTNQKMTKIVLAMLAIFLVIFMENMFK